MKAKGRVLSISHFLLAMSCVSLAILLTWSSPASAQLKKLLKPLMPGSAEQTSQNKKPAKKQTAKPKPIIHDSEHYILLNQHGEKWAAEDTEIDTKLAAIEQRNNGKKPKLFGAVPDN